MGQRGGAVFSGLSTFMVERPLLTAALAAFTMQAQARLTPAWTLQRLGGGWHHCGSWDCILGSDPVLPWFQTSPCMPVSPFPEGVLCSKTQPASPEVSPVHSLSGRDSVRMPHCLSPSPGGNWHSHRATSSKQTTLQLKQDGYLLWREPMGSGM